jgi:hypothetical protein
VKPLATAALAAAALAAIACGIKPERATVGTTPQPSVAASVAAAKLGETITLSGGLGDNQVAVTAKAAQKLAAAADASFIKPKKGAYLAVTVEVSVAKGKTYACYCDFAVVAKDGSLYEPVWPAGFDQAMQSVTLNAGEKVSGVVVFDLPADAVAGARVQLRPDWANDVRGTWQLP